MVDNGFCLQCTNVHRDDGIHLKHRLKMHPQDQSTDQPTNGLTVLYGGAEHIQ